MTLDPMDVAELLGQNVGMLSEDGFSWAVLDQLNEKRDIVGKSICLLVIDMFSEIDIIEDDLFLGFIYLVHYPVLPHSVFPETFKFADESQP